VIPAHFSPPPPPPPPPPPQADPSLAGVPHALVDPFSLTGERDRLAVLAEAGAPPIAAMVAQSERMRLTFEQMWRHLIAQLMNCAVSEWSFCARFFGDALSGEMFSLTMASSLSGLLAALEGHLLASGDAPGIMLLVALSHAQRGVMAERKCAALDTFFDRVNMLLWPRFKSALDANVASVRAAKDNVRRLAPIDTHAHPVTVRYAELTASIMNLHRRLAESHLSDDHLPRVIADLRGEMEALLQRMAGTLPPGMAQVALMINSYSACLTAASIRGMKADDAAAWDKAADRHLTMLAEGSMDAYFRAASGFVRKTEAAAAAAAGIAAGQPVPPVTVHPAGVVPPVNPAEAEAVLRDFNSSWRTGLKGLYEEVVRYFGSSGGAGEGGGGGAGALFPIVLKRVMTAFVALYDRLVAVLTRGLPSGAPLLREVLERKTVILELQKYSREMERGMG